MPTRLFIEIYAPNEVVEVISERFAAVYSLFRYAAEKAGGYPEIGLTVLPFAASTERVIIKLSDPFVRSFTADLQIWIRQAWEQVASAICDEVVVSGESTIMFYTSQTE